MYLDWSRTKTSFPDTARKDAVLPAEITGTLSKRVRVFRFLFPTLILSTSLANGEQFGDFTYAEAPVGEITITFHSHEAVGPVQIPTEIEGLPVTQIGAFAFSGSRGITSVCVPENVTLVGRSAFSRCVNLRTVDLPTSLEKIGTGAFSRCYNLSSITIPSALEIGGSAFGNCRALTGVILPPNLSTIEVTAFYDCINLSSITIPENVLEIESGTFLRCANLKVVELSPLMHTLGSGAFEGCQSLTTITLPPLLNTLRGDVFKNCSSLTSILTAKGQSTFASVDGVLFNSDHTQLVNFPPGRTGNYQIPIGTLEIGYQAFSSSQLTSIRIPASVRNVLGANSFGTTPSLTEIAVDPENTSFKMINGILFNADRTELLRFPAGKNGWVRIPLSTLRIGDGAFLGCSKITDFVVPESVTSVGYSAFRELKIAGAIFFTGDAPTFESSSFESSAIQSTVGAGPLLFHRSSRSGFDALTAQGFATAELDETQNSILPWLVSHGLPPTTPLGADHNGDDVSLLIAYAMGLNPNLDLRSSIPMPIVSSSTIDLLFPTPRPELLYSPETSTDLLRWTTAGVVVGEPDQSSFRTATVPRDSLQRFMRLSVRYFGPRTATLTSGPLQATFESETPGNTSGSGDDQVDNLAWYVGGTTSSVQSEAGFINPPDVPGQALLLTPPETVVRGHRLHFMSENIGLSGVSNQRVIATVDLRTAENSNGSDFEEDDVIEAWLEGSADGTVFARFEGSSIIPRLTGDIDLQFDDPENPTLDDLKMLELPAGGYTTFSTEGNLPVPPEIRFIRIQIMASLSSDSEHLFIDNVSVLLRDDP